MRYTFQIFIATVISLVTPIAANADIIGWVNDFLDAGDKKVAPDKVDWNLVASPKFSSDTGLGIVGMAEATYFTNPADSLLRPSEFQVDISGTTGLLFELEADGFNYTHHNNQRLGYRALLQWYETKYYGIGFDDCANDRNSTRYKYLMARASVDYCWRMGRHIYLGPMANVEYMHGIEFANTTLLYGQPTKTFSAGVGATFKLDSRDDIRNAQGGQFFELYQLFYPGWMGNDFKFSRTEFSACTYHPVWKGCIMALRLHGQLSFGDVPWGMMPTLGGTAIMRGYYEGRYRDNNEMDLTLEFRQHIWKRSGIVVWLAAANIFPRFGAMRLKHTLPEVGVGYRFRYRKTTNIRFDVGLGRDGFGAVVNINEAF